MVPSSSGAMEIHEITPEPFTGAVRAAERTTDCICATSSPSWQRRRSARRRARGPLGGFPANACEPKHFRRCKVGSNTAVDPVTRLLRNGARLSIVADRAAHLHAAHHSGHPCGSPRCEFRRVQDVRQPIIRRSIAPRSSGRPRAEGRETAQTLMSQPPKLAFTPSRSGAVISVRSRNCAVMWARARSRAFAAVEPPGTGSRAMLETCPSATNSQQCFAELGAADGSGLVRAAWIDQSA
jgi:hypothetical protein